MKIEIIQMENIRSHVKSTIPFTQGFNCLVGGVGTGKSSVLYAIDFAFFGEPIGRSFEYLLREGADSAKVTVQFTQNGRTYKLVRGLRKRRKGVSQDFEELKLFEDERVLASMKTDAVAEQFEVITGLNKELYREIMWVRQEHLKDLLDSTPRDRQRRLDKLFGLSDYDVAWSNIAIYKRDYETERRIFEKDPDVVAREKLGDEYNHITKEYTLLEVELQDSLGKLACAKRAREDAETKLKNLESKKIQVEKLKRKEAEIKARVSSVTDTVVSLDERIEGKKIIIENLRQRQSSLKLQVLDWKEALRNAGVPVSQSDEVLREHLTVIEDEISSLKGKQEAILQKLEDDKKRTESLSMENRCPLCLQSLNDSYKARMIERVQQETVERQNAIKQLQDEIKRMKRKKTVANEAFSNLLALTTRCEDLATRLSEEEKTLDKLKREFKDKRQLEAELRKQLETLQFEISKFEIADLEAARNQREQAFAQYYRIEADLSTKENRKKDLLRRLDEVKDRIDRAQEKFERMQKISRTVEIIETIRDAYRSIQPKMRKEFMKVLRSFVQQVLDKLVGGEMPLLNINVDETYTPFVKSESGVEREVSNLSGGERTLMAFAYRLGLGQLIMQSRTGHGLSMLLLDEPTESLGREDGSIDRLAEAISRFRAIEQIIAVTHSEAFAEKAEHAVILEKEAGISKISLER